MNRGDRREKIFKDDKDRHRFLEALGQAREKTKTEWGIPKDSPAGRRHFSRCIEHRRKQECPKAEWRAVERGWFLGDPAFKAELLSQVRERRADHYGTQLREADARHAERVLRQELQARGWTEAELAHRRKGDPEKVEIAWQLRCRTTMTLKWLAQRLKMGAWTHVSNCLVQRRKEQEKCQ